MVTLLLSQPPLPADPGLRVRPLHRRRPRLRPQRVLPLSWGGDGPHGPGVGRDEGGGHQGGRVLVVGEGVGGEGRTALLELSREILVFSPEERIDIAGVM